MLSIVIDRVKHALATIIIKHNFQIQDAIGQCLIVMCFWLQLYEHILTCLRDVSWTYGKVACATYPLEQIDTINTYGDVSARSAMFCIVYGASKDKYKTFSN